MKCPICGGDSRVVNSRGRPENSTRRQRECLADPEHGFTTDEVIVHIGKRSKGRPKQVLVGSWFPQPHA